MLASNLLISLLYTAGIAAARTHNKHQKCLLNLKKINTTLIHWQIKEISMSALFVCAEPEAESLA